MVRSTAFFVPPLLLLSSLSTVFASVVHDGFIDEVVTSTKAMSGTFLPNPRNGNKPMMILNAKNGQIYVLEDPDESPDSIEIMDLSEGPKVCNNGERGLHTVIPSPNFAENRHLFAFFTKYKEDCLEDPVDGPHNVVMRFMMDPETLMLDYDEGTLIFRGAPMDERLHNGGAMAFGNDGKLYITTGDAGKRQNAGTFDDVHGSIIRLNEDGTVPDDNPYTKASGYPNSYRCADTDGRVPKNAPDDSYCAEVWANGLRNPFRIDMDPNEKEKVKFTFGVVGAQHIESIYYGGTDYKGTNYGWPKYEGVCQPANMDNCEPNNDPSITMPFHWYEHISFDNGGCIGGQVHVPEGIWPPQYKYLFIDFILLKMYSLEENRPDLACGECSPPLPPTRNETFYNSIRKEGENINEARLVEMWFGPYKDTQALYMTKFGNHDTVIRIRYNGILNKPPKPAFEFKYDGVVTVEVNASTTFDPEGDKLEYQWNFGDNSTIVVGQMITSHQYAQPGEYAVTLIVTDTSGQEQQVSKTIKIGTVPKLKILSPFENSTFAVGQKLRLNGEAVDFLGNPIPEERLTWEVRQHHADHFHPFLDPTNANNFDLFAAPKPEDYLAATNSFLKIVLTAEDEYGLSETVSVDVQPDIVMVNVTTQPPGLDIVIDGFDIETPQTITSWKGFQLPVNVADQPPYFFKKWSDGRKARTRVFPIYQQPNDPLPQVQAIFCGDLGAKCENHKHCCSDYCSVGLNGMCAPMPMTQSPTAADTVSPTFAPSSLQSIAYVVVPDPPASDLEINVVTPPYAAYNGRLPPDFNPKNPIMDDKSSFSDNNRISASFSDSNNNDSNVESEGHIDTITAWISCFSIGVAILAIVWFVVRCAIQTKDKKYDELAVQKSYLDNEAESDYNSNTGDDDDSNNKLDIKATDTGSTQESEDHYNPNSNASPLSQNDDSSHCDISLSFLIPESISSEPCCIDDIESQACASTGSPVSASVADIYLFPPSSPASSITNPKLRCFDDAQKDQNTEVEGTLEYRFDAASTSQSSLVPPQPSVALVQKSFDDVQEKHKTEEDEGMLEYRFDAASTSQSSLILPPHSTALGEKSFDEVLEERSVSLSIPSPEKSVIQSITEKNILPTDNTLAKNCVENLSSVNQPSLSFMMPSPCEVEESFEERDLEETSEAIESLVLEYLSELVISRDETKCDNSTTLSHSFPGANGVSENNVQANACAEEEIDEDTRVLDLLLVDSCDIEKKFLKNHTKNLNLPLSQIDTDQKQEDNTGVSHEDQEVDIFKLFTHTSDGLGSHPKENELNSVDPTKLTEDSSILSQLCIASVSEETETPAKSSPFTIKRVVHESSESPLKIDVSPLKLPTLQPKQPKVTEHFNFMSPQANNPQKQQKETPETLSMSYDADDSVELYTPAKSQSKSTGLNLQSSFAASTGEYV